MENMHDIVFEKTKVRGGTVNVFMQKQPPEEFFKKSVMRNFAELTREQENICDGISFLIS